MKVMLLYTGDDEEWAARPPEDTARAVAAHGTMEAALDAAGRFHTGYRLRPKSQAKTVRPRGGGLVVTDGPFAETREHIGGFHLIEVESVDEALDWVAKGQRPRGSDAVEVRPARNGAEWGGPVQGKLRFMLLLMASPETLARHTRDEGLLTVDRHYELLLELGARGRLVASRSLDGPERAKTVRGDGGRMLVSDGPFAETGELLAGYFIVSSDDIDGAVEVAKALCPGVDAVEVRPIWDRADY